MRILVIHCAYQLKSGEDIVVQEEMKLLKSYDNNVELLTFSNEGSVLLKLLQLPFNLSSYAKTIRTIREFQPDVVHIHNLHFAGSASVLYAVKRCNVPMVMTLHNYRLLCPAAILFVDGKLFLDSINQSFPYNAVKKKAFRNSYVLTAWMALSMKLHNMLGTYHLPDKLIFLTEYAKDVFRQSHLQLHEDSVVVKPNFIYGFPVASLKRGDHFFYVGRLSEDKGTMLLLETFAESDLTIQIAGDGPMKDLVQSYSAKHPNIQYLGTVSNQQVHIAMQKASALLFPSIWYEGMPLTIIEAFACYLPVIASNLGAMRSMINDGYNGLHFEPGNKTALTKALYNWHSLTGTAKEVYRNNARTTYERLYSPENNVAQLTSIYRSVTGNKQVPSLSVI